MVVVLAEVPDELLLLKSAPIIARFSEIDHDILRFENDDTDQIHDATARQSRWALGIGLTIC
jgi:hypothetical protein